MTFIGAESYQNTHLKKTTPTKLKLKVASSSVDEGMIINGSSLYCLQANEMNIGCRKVSPSNCMQKS